MKFELFISDKAEIFLKEKLGSDNALQIRIKSSGCAGYSYVLQYVKKENSNVKFKNIHFDVLEKDMDSINMSLIDLKKEGLNTKLIFDNPQAHNECGCGESFSLRK